MLYLVFIFQRDFLDNMNTLKILIRILHAIRNLKEGDENTVAVPNIYTIYTIFISYDMHQINNFIFIWECCLHQQPMKHQFYNLITKVRRIFLRKHIH